MYIQLHAISAQNDSCAKETLLFTSSCFSVIGFEQLLTYSHPLWKS